MATIPADYYSLVSRLESGGNPYAKAATSTASGLYQFTKKTWEGLGYSWANVFDVGLQNEAMRKVTNSNASYLERKGIDVNNSSLYASHFFGPSTASKVLTAPDNAAISSLVSKSVVSANSFLQGMTVADFKAWLAKKTGTTMGANATSKNTVLDKADAILKGAGSVVSGTASTVADAAVGVVSAPGDLFSWLKELFSFHTAARFSAVIIGVIFIGLAIAALTLTSENNLIRKAIQ